MKQLITLAALVATTALSGCAAIDAYNNARAGYNAYRGVEGMKSMASSSVDVAPYDAIYVKADLKPRKADAAELNAQAEAAYCDNVRTIVATAKDNGLPVKAITCVTGTPPAANYLTVTLREVVEEGTIGRLLSGGSVRVSTTYIDAKSGTVLEDVSGAAADGYKPAIGFAITAMEKMLVLSGSPKNDTSETATKGFTENMSRYSSAIKGKLPTFSEAQSEALDQS